MTSPLLADNLYIIHEGNIVMKRLLCIIVIATCLLSACVNPLIEESAVQNEDIENVITAIEQTEKPSVTLPVKSEKPQATQTPKPAVIPTVMPTLKPKEQVTEETTPIRTVKPTVEPTKAPTPQPTAIILTPKPTAASTPEPTQETQNEIIPVSSAFINAAMAEINKQREVDGIAHASFSSSAVGSCSETQIR